MNKHLRRAVDHLWGPTGSVILHIIVVFLLINYLVWETDVKSAEVEVKLMDPEVLDQDELQEILDKLQDMDSPMTDVDIPDVQLNDVPDPTEFDAPQPMEDFAALDILSDVQGPLILKGLMAGRSAAGRISALRQFAGRYGEMTEPAVIKALEWLKYHQKPDGSWETGEARGDVYQAAVTSLGLLAFLAHGETVDSERYGATVEKAIKWLTAQQGKNQGGFCGLGHYGSYAHAMGTYAISEAFAMTRIPDLKDNMEQAVAIIVRGQQASGGWDYGYGKAKGRRDRSVASWQMQALKAAYLAGAQTPGVKDAIDGGVRDYRTAFRPKTGYFNYSSDRQGDGSSNITAMTVLCMQLVGKGRDEEVLAGINSLANLNCTWEDEKAKNWDMYVWYYVTQAKFHHGGMTWKDWNDKFARAYVENQQEDGHWIPPYVPKANDNAGRHHEFHYGPAFTTALGALTLQVYYRFLPTYQQIEVDDAAPTQRDSEDIEIII